MYTKRGQENCREYLCSGSLRVVTMIALFVHSQTTIRFCKGVYPSQNQIVVMLKRGWGKYFFVPN